MKPCVFCSIIAGTTPSAVVLDEPTVVAFLDASPVFPGHVLVVPREHLETLTDLSPQAVNDVFLAAQRIAVGVTTSLAADGTWVSMNNTVSQSVPHLHVHVVPRRRKDGLRGFYWPRQKYVSPEDMNELAAKIAASIPLHMP
jgi:histidine triad (HIT) family protein